MIKGIGTDMLDISRIEKYIDNDKFLKRILHAEERAVYNTFKADKRKKEYLAGRFCVKEAYAKALGTGIGELAFHDICCLNDDTGRPYIKSVDAAYVSITHTDTTASAFVVIASESM